MSISSIVSDLNSAASSCDTLKSKVNAALSIAAATTLEPASLENSVTALASLETDIQGVALPGIAHIEEKTLLGQEVGALKDSYAQIRSIVG